MAKKIPPKITERYIVIHDDENKGVFSTLDEAKSEIDTWDMDGAVIYKVVQAWEARFPEEPEIEFHDLGLEQV